MKGGAITDPDREAAYRCLIDENWLGRLERDEIKAAPRLKHNGRTPTPQTCGECGHECVDSRGLSAHRRIVHEGQRPRARREVA
jgi:hypothetical protein